MSAGRPTPNANARKTHCPRGHCYSETNTYLNNLGKRVCKQCKSDHDKTPEARERANRLTRARRKAVRGKGFVAEMKSARGGIMPEPPIPADQEETRVSITYTQWVGYRDLEAALTAERARTLEEAVKVCDAFCKETDDPTEAVAVAIVAARIRQTA